MRLQFDIQQSEQHLDLVSAEVSGFEVNERRYDFFKGRIDQLMRIRNLG